MIFSNERIEAAKNVYIEALENAFNKQKEKDLKDIKERVIDNEHRAFRVAQVERFSFDSSGHVLTFYKLLEKIKGDELNYLKDYLHNGNGASIKAASCLLGVKLDSSHAKRKIQLEGIFSKSNEVKQ